LLFVLFFVGRIAHPSGIRRSSDVTERGNHNTASNPGR
jgi:hypothetical protein